MNKLFRVALTGGILSMPITAFAADTEKCMPDMEARMMLKTNTAQSLPAYGEGPAIRVQRQHMNTALTPHTKYLPVNEGGVMICQYYNHVGWAFQYGYKVGDKITPPEGVFWREDYMNSKPAQDKTGSVFIDVCMAKKEGSEYPSILCEFKTK